MAEGKKSFVLYCDLVHTVKKLTNEQAGELFKHILSYVNDENPTTDNTLVDIVFEPIKQSLKRDLKKYESRAERARENGKKGGRPKTKENPKKPSGLFQNPEEPKKPDSVNVSDSVNVNEKESIIYRAFDHLKITIDEVEKLKEEYTIEQIDEVLDSIQNYAKNKQYKSLNLTLRNWLNRKYPKEQTKEDRIKNLLNNF